MSIEQKLTEFERQSKLLEPLDSEFDELMGGANLYAKRFIHGINDRKAFLEGGTDEKFWEKDQFSESGIPFSDLLEFLDKAVDTPGLNPASGGHLGYIPGGGIVASAVGDFLADITNRYAGIAFAGPGAVKMENRLIRWMADLIGFPESAGGNLASGGSIANLSAIVAARDASGIKSKDFDRAIIYLTTQAHHSVDKAIRISGLGEAVIRYVPMDDQFRMRVDELERMIKEDLANGLIPFLAVAAVGTTDTGAVDPIEEIASIAKEHNIWLHVDGAYGGFFILCVEGREKIRGLHLADSVVMDPHKTLFLPYGLGAVLVKDVKHLMVSNHYTAGYMQDVVRSSDNISPADVSPELTKHFRGLRMWLPLRLHGLAPFRAGLSEKIWLCRYFYQEVAKISGMERGPEPELSVCIFRYRPLEGDINDYNKKLIAEIHKDGRVFLSSTALNGEVWIRAAIVAFRTHKYTVDRCLEMINDCIQKVNSSFS